MAARDTEVAPTRMQKVTQVHCDCFCSQNNVRLSPRTIVSKLSRADLRRRKGDPNIAVFVKLDPIDFGVAIFAKMRSRGNSREAST